LGAGNGRRFFRYVVRELKAPALVTLDLCLPKCSERYAREIAPILMTLFRSSPLIEDLTIRMNRSVAIKVLNALQSPYTEEALVSSGNILLPHLRRLEFDQLFDDRNDALLDEFLRELEYFLIFRLKTQGHDVESGSWQRNADSKALECLKLESCLYDEGDCFHYYVQNFVCVPDGKRTPYIFRDLDERRSDADEAETTWDDGDHYTLGDDDGLDAESEEDEYTAD